MPHVFALAALSHTHAHTHIDTYTYIPFSLFLVQPATCVFVTHTYKHAS